MTALPTSLYNAVTAFIQSATAPPEQFSSLAVECARWQADVMPWYGRFAEAEDCPLSGIRHWMDIPAIPVRTFKRRVVATGDPQGAQHVFETSGTVEGTPGRRYVFDRRVFALTAQRLAPTARNAATPRVWVILVPPPAQAPKSSLSAFLAAWLSGTMQVDVHWCWNEHAPDFEQTRHVLSQAAREGTPVSVFGTALVWWRWIEWCAEANFHVQLSPGSVVWETGGYKGQYVTLSPRALDDRVCATLGVPLSAIRGEYGMTELASAFLGETRGAGERWFTPPPWTRVRIMQPCAGQVCAPGEEGMIRIWDLANVDAAVAIDTEDVGIAAPDGSFRVTGRAAGAPMRGCSLAAEVGTS